MNILAINSGSSSLKCKVVTIDDDRKPGNGSTMSIQYEGSIEAIGPAASIHLRRAGVTIAKDTRSVPSHAEAVRCLLTLLKESGRRDDQELRIEAVGHRVVHGGERFREPVLIDDVVLTAIDGLAELAPLHNPGSIAGIKGARAVMGPSMPMVAVFDTAFHHSLPPHAATYAIDPILAAKHGIRRYGFHGIAHASLAGRCAEAMKRPLSELKLITIQLGSGCSATAIDRGRWVDTSMGFTPWKVWSWGRDRGDLDPAVVGHLSRKEAISVEEVEHLWTSSVQACWDCPGSRATCVNCSRRPKGSRRRRLRWPSASSVIACANISAPTWPRSEARTRLSSAAGSENGLRSSVRGSANGWTGADSGLILSQ